MRTYQFERLLVGLVLTAVWFCTGCQGIELLGSLAVLATFCHAQIGDRMAERQAARETPDVHCYEWSNRYYVMKEGLWFGYFVVHRNWAALVGVAVFLAYPLWRVWWRRHYPLDRV